MGWGRGVAAEVPEDVHPRPTPAASTAAGTLVLFFFYHYFLFFLNIYFDFLTKKSGWKKVALKIQSIVLYFSFRQAKR